jgi:hypothetical protein
MLQDLELLAKPQDVPYPSLLKIFLAGRIEMELRGSRRLRKGLGSEPWDGPHFMPAAARAS